MSNPYLSEKETVSLFVDLHLTDNIIDIHRLSDKGKHLPGHYYNYVFKKYNLSRGEFDSCLLYYAHHPEKYEYIYELVTDSLRKLKKQIYEETYDLKEFKKDSINLWTKQKNYRLKGDRAQKIPFKFPVSGKGTYVLKAKIKISPDDQSQQPRMEILFTASKDKVEMLSKTKKLVKDNVFHDYAVKLGLSDLKLTHIEGFLLTVDNKYDYYQHIEIKDIKLLYISGF